MLATHLLRPHCSKDYSKLLFRVFLHSMPLLSYYFSAHLTLNFSDFEQRSLLHFLLSTMSNQSFISFILAVLVAIMNVFSHGHLIRYASCCFCSSLMFLQMRVALLAFIVATFDVIVGSGPSSH